MFNKISNNKTTVNLRKAGLIASIVVAASVTTFGASTAQAEFPTKPITIIVPYNPGGGTDTTGRFLANEAQKHQKNNLANR